MNIKPAIYESLTPRQRLIATIEAMARKDHKEADRLQETCPKLTYKGMDITYSMTLQVLITSSLIVENTILGNLITLLAGAMADRDELVELSLQNIVNIQTAWHETLKAMGIDPASISKFGMPPHPMLKFYSDLENLPEPDAVRAKQWRDVFEGMLQKVGGDT